MLHIVIAHIRILCVKGSYSILMCPFSCADTELCLFVYNWAS